MKFKVSAILPMPAETYFVERDSSAFRSLVCEMCKLESLEVGNSYLEGETEVYEFVTKPDVHRYVPSQFKHFIPGGDLHYTDVIEYDPKRIDKSPYRMRVHSIPPIFSNKAKIESTMIIEEVTPETCRQTLEGVVDIKIIGLGHVTEKIIVENLKGVYKGVPKIVERWVKFRNEVMKQPGGRDVLIQGRPKNSSVPWINDQIRALIKAEDSDSEADTQSTASPHDSWQQDQLPSVEEMMEQCSIHSESATPADTDDDEDAIFFDARENPTFMNLSESVQRSLTPIPSLDRKKDKDQRHAVQLVDKYQRAGHKLKKIEVDASPASTTDKASRIESQRFGPDYNQQLGEWREFWKEHEVPEAKHVKHSDFRNRLGHVFGLGADAGMFKHPEGQHIEGAPEGAKKHKEGKKHHRFHLRHKHKQPVEYEEHSIPSTDGGSQGSYGAAGASSHRSEDAKDHSRAKGGGFVKDIFARLKSHEGGHGKGHDRSHDHEQEVIDK